MGRYFIQGIFAFFVLLLVSCSKERVLDELDRVKAVGDENPQKALVMLDSLTIEVRESSGYAKSKYDLLRIRLNDKADNVHNSDIMIKKLVKYFSEEGTPSDKQEVYYYAGSVYRDLQDTPRALEYFFKSLDYAADNKGCDSMMLRNTYSNLNDLYYIVQDYNNAVDMAHKELDVCKKIGADDIVSYMHLGAVYYALDSVRQAEAAYDAAFSRINSRKDISSYQYTLIYLLCGYSDLGKMPKAKKCLSLIKTDPLKNYDAFFCLAFAQYYESSGKPDSAAIYCKRILDDGTDIYNMYDAAKLLYKMYNKIGDVNNSNLYAKEYMKLSEKLDFGKRQEQAATVNNRYQYHLDQKKEQDLRDEKERYKNVLVVVSFVTVLLASLGCLFYMRRRNRHLQKIVALSSELQRVSDTGRQLREDIVQKEQELATAKASLDKSVEDLNDVQQKLQHVNAELSEKEKALEAKERQLAEKMEQNRTFIRLLHQSELESKAEDVIYAVRQSAVGKKDMKPGDWKQLYKAVDELYPSLREKLMQETGPLTEQQMQVCYLMQIGLVNQQIQNLTGLSRTTVWRWMSKYDWISASGGNGNGGGGMRMED